MFLLNLQSKVPINEQIQNQIIKFINAGVLKPHDKLPSVRELARENGINPNTVERAYKLLEKSGYVYNFPKKGVYVAEKKDDICERIKPLIVSLKDEGVTYDQIKEVIEEVYGGENNAED